MSALRINVPGKPIEFIELGPARARVAGSTILGWAIEPEMVKPLERSKAKPAEKLRGQHYIDIRAPGFGAEDFDPTAPRKPVRCGQELSQRAPTRGRVCGLPAGHRDCHRSYESYQRHIAQKRARREALR